MSNKQIEDIFYYKDLGGSQKDKRPIKEIREELYLSLLGILGYNSKEAFKYIEQIQLETSLS